MARTVTKSLASAIILGLDATKDFKVDESGMPLPNVELAVSGAPSMAKAQRLLKAHVGHPNCMVIRVDVDETKLNVSPYDFFKASKTCEDDESYGREFITQTFKYTYCHGFAMLKTGMKPVTYIYFGTSTSNNKLLAFVRDMAKDEFGDDYINATLNSNAISIVEERRYLSREKYLELAR